MLIFVMHNDQEYLNSLAVLARKEGINGVTVVEKEGIGTSLKGCSSDMVFHSGQLNSEFGRALIGVTSKEKAASFFREIESQISSGLIGPQEKAFMCMVPFSKISDITESLKEIKPEKTQPEPKPEPKVKPVRPERKKGEIRITDFLSADRIITDLTAENKEDAIKQLVDTVKGDKRIKDIEKFEEDVMYREKLAPTSIGKKCAIPHSRSETVKDIVLAFGKCPEGIDFGDENGEPVNFIFLVAVPQDKEKLNIYLRLLAILSNKLNDKAVRNSLLDAENENEILEIFDAFDSVKVKTESA